MKKLSAALIVLICLVFTLTWMGCSNSSSQTSKETTMPTSAVSSKATALGGESSTVATSSSPTDATSALTTSQGILSTTTAAATTAATTKTFTKTELQPYDGQNGNPAYVAVNGYVYDVTNVPQWDQAIHHGHVGGTDLTSVMNDSPHGTSVLDGLTIVGTYIG